MYQKKSSEDITYISILRIIACFLVIVNHSHSNIYQSDSSNAALFYCMGFALCKMAVAIFIMISGILMLDKDYTYKKIGCMTFKIAVPMIILLFCHVVKGTGIREFNIIQFVKNLFEEPIIYQYWYMYMLLGFYLVIPFVQKMVRNFKPTDYKVFITLFLLIPSLLSLMQTYLGFAISDFVFYSFFPMLLGVVVAGNYISKMKLERKYFISAIMVFIVSYIEMFLSCYIPYLKNGEVSYRLDSWNAFPVVLMALSFVYMMRYIFETRSLKSSKFVNVVAKTTFGVYLLHTFVIGRIAQMNIMQQLLDINCVVGITAIQVAIFALCSALIFVLERIPVVKKFV